MANENFLNIGMSAKYSFVVNHAGIVSPFATADMVCENCGEMENDCVCEVEYPLVPRGDIR